MKPCFNPPNKAPGSLQDASRAVLSRAATFAAFANGFRLFAKACRSHIPPHF